jgi:hypothetical protein
VGKGLPGLPISRPPPASRAALVPAGNQCNASTPSIRTGSATAPRVDTCLTLVEYHDRDEAKRFTPVPPPQVYVIDIETKKVATFPVPVTPYASSTEQQRSPRSGRAARPQQAKRPRGSREPVLRLLAAYLDTLLAKQHPMPTTSHSIGRLRAPC